MTFDPALQAPRVAVVIPAYRVEHQIEKVLAAMPPEVERVVVVDDGSPDGLAARIASLNHPKVTLLRHARNSGVGAATVTGMLHALEVGSTIVVKCDGDGQMDPSAIPDLLAPLMDGVADHSKGTRFYHFRELRTIPKVRFIGNIGLTFLTKLVSGYWNILDPVNGFFATRSEVLRLIPLRRLSRRYFFEIDLLVRLNIVAARVVDVPVPARYEGNPSSLSVARTLASFPWHLTVALVRRLFWRYLFFDVSPVAVFGLLGAILIGFGGVFGVYHWILSAITGISAPLGTIMLAAMPVILGFQLVLQGIVLDIQNTPRPTRRRDATSSTDFH